MFEDTGMELLQFRINIRNTHDSLQPTVCLIADVLGAGHTIQRRRLLANSNG